MGKLDSRLDNIFGQALEIADVKERAAFVERACGGDATLRQEVESLLKADQGAGDFMKATQVVGPANLIPSEQAGDRIGRYKLLEQIGEGGFGVVWMAEQEEPVRRRVALKIIKLGMDTKEVVARFEAERQALAMMDHPNIASVFDGGATSTGRPYFVMELVKGIPITQFCDERKLATRERLELFMQVCQAVQHAHQKGVIHRDLKPSNILVTERDDRPVPKVIDFGIAKATQARLTEKTLFTRLNQWIGTPAYMSPEQAGLASLDVDTRSDVYSLGVLLYELLTGRTPFDTQKLLAAGYEAVMRTIREEEPPKPSTRLSSLTEEELSTVAARRGAEPGKLNRLVRGDLDWVVMKALEKDRARRYDTAASLAQDVERHLHAKPVSAAAPDFLYLASKFVRRNRTRLAFAGLVLTVVTLAAVGGKFALNYQSASQDFQATSTNAVFNLAKSGDAKALARLLDANPLLVNHRDAEGSPPLIYAAGAGNTNALPLLIARGAAVDATNRSGLTALGNAAGNNRTAAALILIAAGADPNHADASGVMPLHSAAMFGAVEVGRALLAKGARTEVFAQSARLTPLSQAAMVGHADFVDLLLAHRASVETRDPNGQTPLHFASTGRRVADLLVAWKAEVEKLANRRTGSETAALALQQTSNRLAALETSLPAGSLQGGSDHRRVVEALLAHGAALEATNSEQATPLLLAAFFTNLPVAEVLVAHKANLDARAKDGSPPLNIAALKGSVPIAELLLEAGAKMNVQDKDGFTPLNTAIEHGNTGVAKVLLAHDANPNLPTLSGQTPMHTAAGYGNVEMLRLLLDHGAALHAIQNAGTPLSLAVQYGQVEAVKFLLQRDAKPDVAPPQNSMTSLHWAAALGRADLVKPLLDAGATRDAGASGPGTPLHFAVRSRAGAKKWIAGLYAQFPANAKLMHLHLGSDDDYLAVLRLLLDAKANPNASESRDQRTPIYYAVNEGQVAAVELLLNAGAKLDGQDRVGQTPLHAVCELEAPAEVVTNIVTRLLQAGAEKEARDQARGTPLHAAANAGRAVMAALLLEAGARFNAVGPHNATPLQLAVAGGHRDVVEVLLRRKLDLDWRNEYGATALLQAVHLRALHIAKLLIEHGAEVDAATIGITNTGITALMISARESNLDMMKLLLDHQAEIEKADEMGMTALNRAAQAGRVDAVKLLLDRGATLKPDGQGNTPAMTAAKSGPLEMLKFLLDRDAASLTKRDDNGFTLLHGAADHAHLEVVQFLLERGLDVNSRSADGYTPLHAAANGYFTNEVQDEVQYVAVIQQLLAHGAKVNAPMENGQTPLHRAAEWGRPKILAALLAAGADSNARDLSGKTAVDCSEVKDESPLRSGVAAGRKACAELLRSRRQHQTGEGAIPKSPPSSGTSTQAESGGDRSQSAAGNNRSSEAAARFYFPASIFAIVNGRPILDSEVREKLFSAEELLRRQSTNNAAVFQRKLQEQQQAALEDVINDELIRSEGERVERRVSEGRSAAEKQRLDELRAKAFIRYFGGVAANSVSSQKRVHKIQVRHVGPSSVGDAQIRSRLRVKEGDPVTQSNVDQDIRSLYGTGDFYNIRVAVAESDGGITLTYAIQERPVLDDIQFAGNKALSSAELLRKLTSKTGERLDEWKLFNDALSLQSLYQKAGFPKASVKFVPAINEQAGRGSVTFEITESP